MTTINRRDLVKMIGGAGAGVAATLAVRPGTARAAATTSAPNPQVLPWPYKPLDPEAIAQRATDGYYKAECMYGSFEAIVGATAEQLGSPYKDFPFLMMKYGGGGINGWGTVCGALSGAAAGFQLLSPKPEVLIDAIFVWYEGTALPDFLPKGAKFPEIRSVSGTPLCHTSISKWCAAAQKTTYSPERRERCGALSGAVARKAVMLLNEQAAAKPITTALPAVTQNCMSCHERGGAVENSRGKMNCGGCHSPMLGKHPAGV
jgi:hypothetical protein